MYLTISPCLYLMHFVRPAPDSALLGIKIKLHVEEEHIKFYEDGLKDYPGDNALKVHASFGRLSFRSASTRLLLGVR